MVALWPPRGTMNTHRSAEAAQTRTRTEAEPISEVVRRRDERAPAKPELETDFEDGLYDNVACTD